MPNDCDDKHCKMQLSPDKFEFKAEQIRLHIAYEPLQIIPKIRICVFKCDDMAQV
jgi:hypothetical protein